MPFTKGKSGNPGGRPKGSVSPRVAIRNHIRANPSELHAIIQAQFDKARDGDTAAYKALTEWIESPMPKQIDLNTLTPEQAVAILAEIDAQSGDDSED